MMNQNYILHECPNLSSGFEERSSASSKAIAFKRKVEYPQSQKSHLVSILICKALKLNDEQYA